MAHHEHSPRAKPVAKYFTCSRHGKYTYGHRADARAAARAHHDPGLREYRCSQHRGCWHIGHVPPPVKRGEVTATEWYDLPPREQRRRLRAETG